MDQLTHQLRALLSNRTLIQSGRVQFIDLETVRRRLGERWPAVADRVRRYCHSRIARRVGRDDLVIGCEDGFLIVWARLEGAEAEVKTAAIVKDLLQFLTGDEDVPDLGVEGRTEAIEVAGLARLLAHAQSQALPAAPAAPVPLPAAAAATDPIPEAEPVERAALWVPMTVAHAAERASERGAEPPHARAEPRKPDAPAPAPAPPGTPELVFVPVWDVQRGVLSTAFALHRRRRPGYADQWGLAAAGRDGQPGQPVSVDLAIVGRVLDALEQMVRDGWRCGLGFQLHYETLVDAAARARVLQALGRAPDWQRRLLFPLIEGMPAEAPDTRKLELVRMVAGFCGRVGVTVPWAATSLDPWAAAGAKLIHAHVPPGAGADPNRAVSRMRVLLTGARRLRAPLSLGDVPTPLLVAAATRLGVAFLSGRPVAMETSAPRPMTRLVPADLGVA